MKRTNTIITAALVVLTVMPTAHGMFRRFGKQFSTKFATRFTQSSPFARFSTFKKLPKASRLFAAGCGSSAALFGTAYAWKQYQQEKSNAMQQMQSVKNQHAQDLIELSQLHEMKEQLKPLLVDEHLGELFNEKAKLEYELKHDSRLIEGAEYVARYGVDAPFDGYNQFIEVMRRACFMKVQNQLKELNDEIYKLQEKALPEDSCEVKKLKSELQKVQQQLFYYEQSNKFKKITPKFWHWEYWFSNKDTLNYQAAEKRYNEIQEKLKIVQ